MESKTIDKKKLIIAIAAVAVIAIVAIVLLILGNGGVRATTMRLLRMEGTVTLEENGKSKTIIDNLRLKSGNAINTEGSSLASIGLDETKIVTMDELSRAEFSQKGKKLDLNLTRGSLFFEVKKPLEDDESFDIRTSTMVVGIRGTSGYVTVDSDGNWNIVVTDGKVHVTGTNPNTGEVKEIDVEAGQRCTVYLYDRDKDSVMFTLDEVTEDEIPDFVVTILREEPELLEKVVSDTDWSKPVILGIEEVKEEAAVEEETEEEQDTAEPAATDEEGEAAVDDAAEAETTENTSSAKERVQPFIASEADGKIILADGTIFDPEYYAKMNPDVVALLGNDRYVLLEHYLLKGRAENRDGSEGERLAKEAAFREFAAALEEDEEDKEDKEEDDSSSQGGGQMQFTAANVVVANTQGSYDPANNAFTLGSVAGQVGVSTNLGQSANGYANITTNRIDTGDTEITLPVVIKAPTAQNTDWTINNPQTIDWANSAAPLTVNGSDGTIATVSESGGTRTYTYTDPNNSSNNLSTTDADLFQSRLVDIYGFN